MAIKEGTDMGHVDYNDQKTIQKDEQKKKKRLCPLIKSPFKDCYFLDMTSNKISMALHYCQNHYMQCSIYKRVKVKEGSQPGKDGNGIKK